MNSNYSNTVLCNIKQEFKQDTEGVICVKSEVPLHLFQYLPFNSNGSKLQNVCRICLTTIQKNKISLLSVYENKMLLDMIRDFTSVQITEVYPVDDLPSYTCETCQSDVVYCYKFKQKCEQSDSILQSLLKGQTTLIPEPVDVKSFKEKGIELEEEFKQESVEDIELEIEEEYLEDLSDNETLCIVQNTDNFKTKVNAIKGKKRLLDEAVSQNKPAKFTCNICFKKFNKVKVLRSHVAKKHSSEKHTHHCEWCKEVFSSDHDLHVHAAVHSRGPLWNCNKCQKAFKARSQLRRHIQRHMEAKRFACESCGKTFSELYALRRHSRVHTGETREKKYACHLCDKKYSENSQLAAHVAGHLGSRRCVCATCGKAFASARLLASHRQVHSDLKRYACSYCDKRFRHESTRNTHHRTHTGEKPYVCATCGKTFIQNSNLTLHMRTHTGERPYSCDKCERKFSTGSSLKAHLRRHTGEKPYGCTVCGKRFARRDMSAHMRQHTGERPHACHACPKTFVSASRLRDHTRMHTGEKPFECASCTKTFSTKSHLVKHLKKHQSQRKRDERELVIVRRLDCNAPVYIDNNTVLLHDTDIKQEQTPEQKIHNNEPHENPKNNITLEITPEVPLEVTRELVVENNCDVKEILVVDSQNDGNYQSGNICINADGVNYVNSDVNLVTVNEGTTVKLYQLDQSLVQIHSSGGQVTISKITSKMTANF